MSLLKSIFVFGLIGFTVSCSQNPKQISEKNSDTDRNLASLCAGERVMCEGDRGRVEVCVHKNFLQIPIVDSSRNRVPALNVSDKITKVLASDKIATLDKKNTTDSTTKYKLSFRIDGYTFDKKPRLEIKIEGPQVNERLSSCLWAPWQKSTL